MKRLVTLIALFGALSFVAPVSIAQDKAPEPTAAAAPAAATAAPAAVPVA